MSLGARILKWQILRAYVVPPELWELLLLEPWTAPTDWTFIGSRWPAYDYANYISSPRSLRSKVDGGLGYGGHSMLTTYNCIPEVRVVNNVRWAVSGTALSIDWLRAQAMPASYYSVPSNCYFLELSDQLVRFGYYTAGAPFTIDDHNFSPALSLDTWYKYRFSLWDYPDHVSPTAVQYLFEIWETNQWTTYLSGIDTPSLWWNATNNYYGNFLIIPSGYTQIAAMIDDTEIWQRLS